MKIALTQMNIIWENPAKNREACQRLTKNAKEQGCDWIVFPEMTLTGFTMRPEAFGEAIYDETAPTCQFFHSLSRQYSISIAYGVISSDEGKYYNQLVLLEPEKILMAYSKLHPFSYGAEALHYSGGDQIMVCRQKDILLSGFICYDLRFPEVFQIASRDAVVIFVIANWPKERISHWYSLLQARAIENQCFIIGVNRTGEGGDLSYPPSSVAFDPYGEPLTSKSSEELLYADIDPALAEQYRREFPVKADRRSGFYRDFI